MPSDDPPAAGSERTATTLRAMRQRAVGRTGLQVSAFGLGTSLWGRDTDEYEARDCLTGFVEAGGTLVETAPGYGGGRSEEVLGGLLGDVVGRDDVVLAAGAGVSASGAKDASRAGLLRSLDRSLQRLGVDAVDLWQVGPWSDRVPWEETLAALDAAVTTGRARYVGVCGYAGWQVALAQAWQLAWPQRIPLASAGVAYSLADRRAERDVFPAAAALGLGVIACAPLAGGVLSAKYRTGLPADSRGAASHLEHTVAPYLDERGRGIVEAVVRAAEGLSLTPVEVALAWVRGRPGVASVIVGARTAAQLRGVLTVEDVELPAEIVAALDDVSGPDRD